MFCIEEKFTFVCKCCQSKLLERNSNLAKIWKLGNQNGPQVIDYVGCRNTDTHKTLQNLTKPIIRQHYSNESSIIVIMYTALYLCSFKFFCILLFFLVIYLLAEPLHSRLKTLSKDFSEMSVKKMNGKSFSSLKVSP